MRRVRREATAPEIVVRRLVSGLGFRFRTNVPHLPGTPDLANQRRGWAILVHGCFWHDHDGCRLATKPVRNRAAWEAKLSSNKERDAFRLVALRERGLDVLVVWECETHDVGALRTRIDEFLKRKGVRSDS